MTKASGIGGNFYVNGFDLSGDVGAIGTIRDSGTLLDVTGISKGAPERITGIADGEISFNAFFNDAAGQEHLAFRDLGSDDKIVTYAVGTAVGKAGAGLVGKQVDYSGQRANDGSLVFTVNAQSSNGDGLHWGRMLTAGVRTDTDATDGGSLDNGAATAFGAVLFLQVFTGTIDADATIKIQDSADNSNWLDLADAAFTALDDTTAFPYAERISLGATATVRRYLRVVTTTSGGFSSLSFAVLAARRYA